MHYFDIYDRHFARVTSKPVRVLEIGVSHGGSLQMWRHYFGRSATIVGIDIDERVRVLEEEQVHIEIGDQSDRAFLVEVIERHGPFDIIIDDGSHMFDHQIASLEALWGALSIGGLYLVEDLHTSYWPNVHGGGVGVEGTFIEWMKRRIDDIHAYHSRQPEFVPNEWTRTISGIHFYDSIVVIEKGELLSPVVRMTGAPSFSTLYGVDVEQFLTDDHRAQISQQRALAARLRRLAQQPVSTVRRVGDRVMKSMARSIRARVER